jgi:hypothetical protein
MKTAAQIADEVLAKMAAKAPKEPAAFEPPKGGFGPPTKKGPESKELFKPRKPKKSTAEDPHATRM